MSTFPQGLFFQEKNTLLKKQALFLVFINIFVLFMHFSLRRPNEGFLKGVRALKYCKNQRICAKMNTEPDLPDLPDLPEVVSATAARSLPSTRAGGQDYGSLTISPR